MHKILIVETFKKAEKELIDTEGIQKPSKLQKALYLENYLKEELKVPIHERTLRDYYNLALKTEAADDIRIAQPAVLKGLCIFINFDSYKEFKSSLGEKNKLREPTKNKRFVSIVIAVGILMVISIILIYKSKEVRWMQWKNDHYEEAEFEESKLDNGILSVYEEAQVEKFKQIKNPDCNYPFFKNDGTVNTWYSKNNEGTIDIFTNIGLHPETGKTLRPMTVYIIKKYLCPSY